VTICADLRSFLHMLLVMTCYRIWHTSVFW